MDDNQRAILPSITRLITRKTSVDITDSRRKIKRTSRGQVIYIYIFFFCNYTPFRAAPRIFTRDYVRLSRGDGASQTFTAQILPDDGESDEGEERSDKTRIRTRLVYHGTQRSVQLSSTAREMMGLARAASSIGIKLERST